MGIWFFSGFPLGCQPAPPTEERCVDRGIMVRIESKTGKKRSAGLALRTPLYMFVGMIEEIN